MTRRFNAYGQTIRRPGPRRRPGMVTIAALTCLLIVTAILGSMLQTALRARRQLHAERDRRQTELLLQAGADRAAVRLASEPEFRGDTWNLPAGSIVGHGAGRVTTRVSRSGNDSLWQVRIVAAYPLGRDFVIQRSHTFSISPTTIQSQE